MADPAPDGASSNALSRRSLAAYGSLELPFTLLTAPVVSLLPPLYAKEFGISLGALSGVLLFLRVLDAVTDPLTGVLSDRTRSRFGPRKPWIAAGIVLSTWSAWNLFVPPESPDVFYIGVWLCGVYVGWTLLEVPYRAWSADLSSSYEERSRLSLVVRFVGNGSLMLFGFLPLLLSPTNEMDFHVLRFLALALVVLMPICGVLALRYAPNGSAPVERGGFAPGALWQCLRENDSLRIFFGVLVIGYLGVGTAGALFFVLFDTYLQIGQHFTLISTTSQVVALCSVALWSWMLTRFEKRTVMIVGLAGIGCTLPIIHLMEPGRYALPMYMLNDALWYTFLMAFEVAVFAMVGDIADAERLRAGDGRAGLICATWALIRKAMYGIGAALAYGITGAAGYDPAAEANSAVAVQSLKFVNGGLPALVCIAGAALAAFYPLDRARHAMVRRALEAREQGAAAAPGGG